MTPAALPNNGMQRTRIMQGSVPAEVIARRVMPGVGRLSKPYEGEALATRC